MAAARRAVLERLVGPTAALVAAIDPPDRFLARLCEPSDAAVVLGSAQGPESVVADAARARGLRVVARRSGGGAVLVAPRAQVWLDLFWPAHAPGFEHDVSRAAFRVGELWRDALAAVLPGDPPIVHRGASRADPFSRRACFSGLGPGEVHRGGRKLVGLCQRRTRAGAWFFSMALLDNRQVELAELLALEPGEPERLERSLTDGVAVVALEAAALEDALAAALGRAGGDLV